MQAAGKAPCDVGLRDRVTAVCDPLGNAASGQFHIGQGQVDQHDSPTVSPKSSVSAESNQLLETLRTAVAEALERKRRLGQYAVIWRDGQVVRLEPADQRAPETAPTKTE